MIKQLFDLKRHFILPFLLTFLLVSCEQEDVKLSSPDLDLETVIGDFNGLQNNNKAFSGRIAISADGNQNDRDDIGATPMGLAIIAHFGLQNNLVHYDYNSWIWSNGPKNQKGDMTESTMDAASHFNFDKNVFISAIDQVNKAEKSIADAINNSSTSNPLYILVGGPMAIVCEGIKRANQDKLEHVTVISHSEVNNNYSENGSCTADEVKQTGVNFVQIKDQNEGLRRSWSEWNWLENHSNNKLQWVHDRMKEALYRWGDVSDAGMVWYMLTNEENANPNKLKSFFADNTPTPTPDDDDDDDNGSGGDGDECQASGNTLYRAIKNFENSCGIKYDKSKGHDCDPDGNGGWICSTGKISDGGSSGDDDDDDGNTGSSNDGDNCQASGKTLNQAIKNFENSCGIKYNKSKGHDCDPDGNGGWTCATSKIQ